MAGKGPDGRGNIVQVHFMDLRGAPPGPNCFLWLGVVIESTGVPKIEIGQPWLVHLKCGRHLAPHVAGVALPAAGALKPP